MSDRQSLKARNLDFFGHASPELHRRLSGLDPSSELALDEAGRADVMTGGRGRYGGDAKAYAARQLDAFWQAPARFALKVPNPYPSPASSSTLPPTDFRTPRSWKTRILILA